MGKSLFAKQFPAFMGDTFDPQTYYSRVWCRAYSLLFVAVSGRVSRHFTRSLYSDPERV